MKYIKLFNTTTEYDQFKVGSDYILPNVSYMASEDKVSFDPYVPPPAVAGDVAYWDGSKVRICTLDSYNESMGIAVGVVVVPSGFAPDGKARIMGLRPVDASGNMSNSYTHLLFGGAGIVTGLPDYTTVPITDNTSAISSNISTSGYLPSDVDTSNFKMDFSYVDPVTRYSHNSELIPSPYLGNVSNPEYSKEILVNGVNSNMFSDFNGLENTKVLVDISSEFIAANAAWNYNDGSNSNVQWYLPSMGELGYLIVRLNVINNTLSAIGGMVFGSNKKLWSSTQFLDNQDRICTFSNKYGLMIDSVCTNDNYGNIYVRAFATID